MERLPSIGAFRSATTELSSLGFGAEHAGQLGIASASEDEIPEFALARGAVVVTLDSDFHTLLAAKGAKGPSTIRIRIEGLKGDAVAALIDRVVAAAATELETGAAVSVATTGTRIRMLPLV